MKPIEAFAALLRRRGMNSTVRHTWWLAVGLALVGAVGPLSGATNSSGWPEVSAQAKPHAYWWWMGNAVDTNNIAKELARYRDAGMGGVHIIPIYGAKGWESNYIRYLSPKWMEMLDFTVTEGKRLGLQVDMTTGTGWCFGGPKVTDEEANAVLVSSQWLVGSSQKLQAKVDLRMTQALMAFGPKGEKVDLRGKILADGSVDWMAPQRRGPEETWTVYAISQKPSGQKVKRAAPGGEGQMLNLAYPKAMTNYLRWMDEAFAHYKGAKPRAQYHDSYEYKMDWSPDFFAQFEKRRGYRLQDELDVFLSCQPADRAARVKCDYRETISDIMAEETLPMWNKWAHERGSMTRNEAHGSPGNWLDLYAAADIPETEMFYKDRNKLISKFASSAAHVTGKPLVGAETGTWLAEHFTETLADMKYLVDDLFLSGVNHVFYHGTCYSPDEAPWPGWVFYASYEMNPRNAVWHDVAALNAYVTRCQSVLQAGKADNDILLYWPIHDFWSDPEGTTRNLTVHARDWFEEQPIGKTAEALWKAGYQFDYVSDRQLARAEVAKGGVSLSGNVYRQIVIPSCNQMPLGTLRKLIALASQGTIKVVFVDHLPTSMPGLNKDKKLESEFAELLNRIQSGLRAPVAVQTVYFGGAGHDFQSLSIGKVHDAILVGKLEDALRGAQAPREAMFDTSGLMCIRRSVKGERYYFVSNRGNKTVDAWVPLAKAMGSVAIMDPMTGFAGVARSRMTTNEMGAVYPPTEVYLDLPPGASVILRAFSSEMDMPAWSYWKQTGTVVSIEGEWKVAFISGGAVTPASFATSKLGSWASLGDTNAASFAGTAMYTLNFEAPDETLNMGLQMLDLGKVCQSARVRLNGKNYGTLFTPPFRVVVDNVKARGNVLELEVTSTSANRIRDLDRRGVKWQNFHDINFVNLNYKKFDASDWPLAEEGLLGPVTLQPVVVEKP